MSTTKQIPGFYDETGNLIWEWDSSKINIERDYVRKTYGKFAPCNVIRYNFPQTKTVVIPDGVARIGKDAFSYYIKGTRCSYRTNLASILIPDSVTSIGDHAFSGCKNLVSIVIPDSVKSIGDFAFSRCESLAPIAIPDSVISIGNLAFARCHALTEIRFGGTCEQWKAAAGSRNFIGTNVPVVCADGVLA